MDAIFNVHLFDVLPCGWITHRQFAPNGAGRRHDGARRVMLHHGGELCQISLNELVRFRRLVFNGLEALL